MRHLYTYGYCRHSPTCSQYAINVVLQRGALIGTALALRRLLTCHPWRTPDEQRVRETIDKL